MDPESSRALGRQSTENPKDDWFAPAYDVVCSAPPRRSKLARAFDPASFAFMLGIGVGIILLLLVVAAVS